MTTPTGPAKPASATPYADARRDILNVLAKFDALLVLRDSLVEAVDAEAIVAKHKQEVTAATQQLMTIRESTKGEEKRLAATQARVVEADTRVSNDLAEKRKKFLADVDAMRQTRDNEIALLRADVEKARTEREALLAGLDTRIKMKRTELAQLETRVADATRTLAEAKARVGGL